jgi:uncharacterized protein (TIGR03067 family)
MTPFLKTSAVAVLILISTLMLALLAQSSFSPRPISERSASWHRLHGDWYECEVLCADGPPPHVVAGALHFDGQTTFSRSGKPLGFYGITPWKTPKEITMTYDPNGPAKGMVQRGIYKVVGDALVICVGDPRPTDFTLPRGSGRILTVYKPSPPRPR